MTPRLYTYTLKLTTGERVVIDKATDPADAMRQAGVMAHQVKRHMPIKAWPTEEERQQTQERINKLRRSQEMKTVNDDGSLDDEAIRRNLSPRIDMTAAGPQYVIPDAPAREVPTTGLKAKRKQTEKPTVLELYEQEQKQIKLF